LAIGVKFTFYLIIIKNECYAGVEYFGLDLEVIRKLGLQKLTQMNIICTIITTKICISLKQYFIILCF